MRQRVHALEEQPHGREAAMAAIRQEWANLTCLELEALVEAMSQSHRGVYRSMRWPCEVEW